MTQGELLQALKSLGMPVTYGEFISTPKKPAPAPPFITYQYAYSSDLVADNHNYLEIGNFQIELYTNKKDLVVEKKMEDKLKELRFPYSKVEAKIQSEGLFQIIYEIQLI